jgi:putative two-component system response regulator
VAVANNAEETVTHVRVRALRNVVAARAGIVGYPDEHAIAVAECAAAIAARLKVTPRQWESVIDGGLLHDVGKTRIDKTILQKPGSLTAKERRTINRHPEEGEMILRGSVGSDVLQIVKSHHERWDGQGYPEGLRGDAIPLPARIVAVADAYRAMREERPYRPPLTADKALAELEDCAGTQFDPSCVEALRAIAGAR